MDYDDNVLELTKALKANSRKRLHKHRIGSKGIGMLQFPNIAPMILFTSMYNGLIARFALLETKPEGAEKDRHTRVGAFTDPKIVAASRRINRSLAYMKMEQRYHSMIEARNWVGFYPKS